MAEGMTLYQLQQTISRLVTTPATQGVWVTAEIYDVAERGGHCYLELIQKDEAGTAVAKARAVIWANVWRRLSAQFMSATGQRFATGLKVMVCVSASYHPLYGLSLVISNINPEFTMGDLLRRRREILDRLKREGTLEMNRQLEFPSPTLRIAIVSAPGAAGYGDFINQLLGSPSRFRFRPELFAAVMQGDRTPETVIAALNAIAQRMDEFDCVVIIRGGGSTSDLSAFEDYNLASHVAQFPLPVIVGIGHERDVTVLDYVACARVKTPTAAAELLLSMATDELDTLRTLAAAIVTTATDRLSGCERQLAYAEGQLPLLPPAAIARADKRLNNCIMALSAINSRRLQPLNARLDRYADALRTAIDTQLRRRADRLTSAAEMLAALSPDATLKRGYSITRIDGHAITSAAQAPKGSVIKTTLATGTIISTAQ